jgi:hypothetical protein
MLKRMLATKQLPQVDFMDSNLKITLMKVSYPSIYLQSANFSDAASSFKKAKQSPVGEAATVPKKALAADAADRTTTTSSKKPRVPRSAGDSNLGNKI